MADGTSDTEYTIIKPEESKVVYQQHPNGYISLTSYQEYD